MNPCMPLPNSNLPLSNALNEDASDPEDTEGPVTGGRNPPLCYPCKHCGRRFASGCGLGGHMRIHNISFSNDVHIAPAPAPASALLMPSNDRSVSSFPRLSSVEVDSPVKSDSRRPLYSLRRNPKRSRRLGADQEFGLFWSGYESVDLLGYQSSSSPELMISGRESSSSSKSLSGHHARFHGYRGVKDCLSEGRKQEDAPLMDPSPSASQSSLDAGSGSDGGWAVSRRRIPASVPRRQKDLLACRARRKRSARHVIKSLQAGSGRWSKSRSTATMSLPEAPDDAVAGTMVDDDVAANHAAADDMVGDDMADKYVAGDDMAKDALVDDDVEADDMASVDVATNDRADGGLVDDDVAGDDVTDRLVMLACAGSILEEESSRWGQSGPFSEKSSSPDREEEGKLARPVKRTKRRKEARVVDVDRKRRIHECTICCRLFPTGQALGGHKRCHWTAFEAKPAEPANTTTTIATTTGAVLLDLNLPAPMEYNSDFDTAVPPPYIKQLLDGNREAEMRHWSTEYSEREVDETSPEFSRFFRCSLCDVHFDSFDAWTKHQKAHAPSFVPVFPGLAPISA